jgi:hypothetical protein
MIFLTGMALSLLTSIERLPTDLISCFPGESGLKNRDRVGWDSIPVTYPESFRGCFIFLMY